MEDEIAEIIREHGWFAASISDGDPPFLYSIGLMQTWGHPELIVFGLEPDDAHALFSGIVREIRNGRQFQQHGVYTVALAEDHRVGIRHVHPTQHPLYLGYAMGYCRYIGRTGELEAVQVFWPDSSGRFPFEVGCDLGIYQLEPGENLKLVPSPRPATIHVWWGKAHPKSRQQIDSARSLVFAWREPDRLRLTATLGTPNLGWRLRDLPQAINVKIEPVVVEGDSDLFDMAVDGDWVVRADATDGQKVLALDRIIQRSLRQRISVSLRQVERDVIVARGRYRPSLPILAGDRIQIYGRRLNKGEAGGGGGRFPNFLEALRDWIKRPILDETEAPPRGR